MTTISQTLTSAWCRKEAAHAILHAEHVDSADYVAHRGLYETEAESVAYVLAGLVGLDTSAYSVGYVTTWTNGGIETVKATAANVLRAVHKLAPALIDEPNPEPGTGTEAA